LATSFQFKFMRTICVRSCFKVPNVNVGLPRSVMA